MWIKYCKNGRSVKVASGTARLHEAVHHRDGSCSKAMITSISLKNRERAKSQTLDTTTTIRKCMDENERLLPRSDEAV